MKSTLVLLRRLSSSAGLLTLLLCSINSYAQYTKLLDFGGTPNGSDPYGSVVTDGTYLYGMTYDGGANNYGIIYKIKADGTGFTKLLDFDGANTGSSPYGSLFFDGTYLYGMTSFGGTNNVGAIFKLKPDGTSFTKLLDFSDAVTGSYPYGSLISDGTFLYGTTSWGGANTYDGTVFKIKPDGTGFVKLHDFDNTFGSGPTGSLYSDGTFLYGTTSYGGSANGGTVFKVMTDGTNFSSLYNFNSGSYPYSSLISDGTYLYGTTSRGGANNLGSVFKILPDGSGFTSILDCNNSGVGATLKGSLAYDGTFLYGTTADYGANNAGTIFKIKTDGTGLVTLLDNDINNQDTYADGTMVFIGSTLYGVKCGGSGYASPEFPGTVFKINNDGSGYNKLYFFLTEATNPVGGFFSDGTFLYSMTPSGGLFNAGALFKIKPDGSGLQDVYDFGATNDGASPYGSVVSDGTFLYGMTQGGGVNGLGTIFKVMPNGTGYSKLFDFDDTNGSSPHGSLFYDGAFLYGMTESGGLNSYGVIFKISTTGVFTKLFDFDGTNSGNEPHGSLISDGTFLYGTTYSGGASNMGIIFKVMKDGSNFTKLLDFDGTNYGSYPTGDLYYDGTFLYASVSGGGAYYRGTIIKVKPDGTSPSKLMDFDGYNSGSTPQGNLVLDGNYLYGITQQGGYRNWGTLFRIKPDGTGFQKYLDFVDGDAPVGSPFINGGFIYGTASYGGANNGGIFFKTTLTPFVNIPGLTPDYGVVGTYVGISGVGFDPTPANNVVKFNGVNAVVTYSTATSLVVIVPNGATTGPISVTANGSTGVTATDFTLTSVAYMTDGAVQNCNVPFGAPGVQGDVSDYVETFVPTSPGDKIKISFSSFSSPTHLYVYDGPTTSSPKVATLSGNSLPSDITATGAGGELTFAWAWEDVGGSSTWLATISCVTASSPPPTINSSKLVTTMGGSANLNLVSLISTANNNLDVASLQIIVPPVHGAASINSGVLSIDYNGLSYVGKDSLTIKACAQTGACSTQQIYIDVVGDIVVYNGISPGGKNPVFVIENIDILPDTKHNTVYIFDRWENQVWHGSDYDNSEVVFVGNSDSGNALPSGVYFYKIDFKSGRSTKTGFISLRR